MAKFTKKMRYEDIIAMTKGEAVPNGSTPDEIAEFCAAQIEALARKNANANSRKTKKSAENDALKDKIMDWMIANLDGGTCADIRKAIPELVEAGEVQKTTALIRQLETAGLVESIKEHGKTIKRLTREDENADEE